MLTFLSRSFREMLDSVRGREPAPPPVRAQPRLVQPGLDRDTHVAAVLDLAGATAFVAGQGARIYSLDAFRPGRGPRPPRAA
jgi:hypothetical protein